LDKFLGQRDGFREATVIVGVTTPAAFQEQQTGHVGFSKVRC
jgi:hypothetical protein